MQQATILQTIIEQKAIEIVYEQTQVALDDMVYQAMASTAPRPFYDAINDKIQSNENAVIAEIKKASPSKGTIRECFNVPDIASSYAQHGATCLSVLTDKYFFKGDPKYLRQAYMACELPLLRKDFIIDPYQIYQARHLGADCVLLIVAALSDDQLKEFTELNQRLSMATLIEVHTQQECERALPIIENNDHVLLGINNRNLHTFETDLNTSIKLKQQIPSDIPVITESGIHSKPDITLMNEHNIHSFLVGEAFMKQDDPGLALKELFY